MNSTFIRYWVTQCKSPIFDPISVQKFAFGIWCSGEGSQLTEGRLCIGSFSCPVPSSRIRSVLLQRFLFYLEQSKESYQKSLMCNLLSVTELLFRCNNYYLDTSVISYSISFIKYPIQKDSIWRFGNNFGQDAME